MVDDTDDAIRGPARRENAADARARALQDACRRRDGARNCAGAFDPGAFDLGAARRAVAAAVRAPGDATDRVCAACGDPRAPAACSRCKAAFYCGRACQRADWARHGPRCARPPSG